MLEVIRTRRSCRNFLQRDIEPEKLENVLMAAMFAPTAKDLRPVEFVVVKDERRITELSKMTPYSGFAKKAPVVIVICYDAEKGRRFREDCSISAAHIYLEAVNQGLGTCFVQVADAQPGPEVTGQGTSPEELIKNGLGLPERFRVQCLMPIGYPEKAVPPHGEAEFFDKARIHYDRF